MPLFCYFSGNKLNPATAEIRAKAADIQIKKPCFDDWQVYAIRKQAELWTMIACGTSHVSRFWEVCLLRRPTVSFTWWCNGEH
jgi:hypothetical protein